MGGREGLLEIYDLLNGHFGDLHWWPADGPFEMMVGAILTQNTAWTNVEKAIKALRENDLMSPAALFRLGEERLREIIRPSGCYRLKAGRLKAFVRFIQEEYGGDVTAMSAAELPKLRNSLLGVRGIGPETADSILLYGCQKPVFVSDAYTKRILLRHGIVAAKAGYEEIGSLFMRHLPHDAPLFNQFHALIVKTGKHFCRKSLPKCELCPLAVLKGARRARHDR